MLPYAGRLHHLPFIESGDTRMRRFAVLLVAGVPSLLGAQGFGIYEHNTCTMGRAGVPAPTPCADGSAIFFSPAGLAGPSGIHLSGGVTLVPATGGLPRVLA